jgi:hypothetical protein
MTSTTAPVAITDAETSRDDWMEARADHRVTASEVHAIAAGGRSTWRRILTDKLNGRTFKGNATTQRGHTREPFLLAYLREFVDNTIAANARLYVHPEKPQFGATPDGRGHLGAPFGVEVKSHGHEWGDRSDIPAEHYDQMQFGMFVLGFDQWLYGWEVMGEDGEPSLENPHHVWVDRDDARIAFLVGQAQAFLDWWEAGAPEADDLPAEVDDALAAWADARARKKAAEADESSAEKIVRAFIDTHPEAKTNGLKRAGRAASFVYSVTEREALDLDALATAEPDTAAALEDLKTRVAEAEKAALTLYHKPVRSSRLVLTPTKEAA